MSISRRRFIQHSSVLAAAGAGVLPVCWARAEDLPKDRKLKLRFVVASDLHYGPGKSKEKADRMVELMQGEKKGRGLDAFFINGDVTHDRPEALVKLRDEHLNKLDVPTYCGKGNHDYVDGKPDSPTASWEAIWGYPANHVIEMKGFVFVMADTSAASDSKAYLAADLNWLKKQFKKYRDAPAIFVLIHIAQRKKGVKGWPPHGVSAEDQVDQAEAVMALIESTPNVRAVFHGHSHTNNGMIVSGEKRYFFSGHIGSWWGGPRGYRVVEIDEQHRIVTYHTFEKEGEVNNRNAFGDEKPGA